MGQQLPNVLGQTVTQIPQQNNGAFAPQMIEQQIPQIMDHINKQPREVFGGNPINNTTTPPNTQAFVSQLNPSDFGIRNTGMGSRNQIETPEQRNNYNTALERERNQFYANQALDNRFAGELDALKNQMNQQALDNKHAIDAQMRGYQQQNLYGGGGGAGTQQGQDWINRLNSLYDIPNQTTGKTSQGRSFNSIEAPPLNGLPQQVSIATQMGGGGLPQKGGNGMMQQTQGFPNK